MLYKLIIGAVSSAILSELYKKRRIALMAEGGTFANKLRKILNNDLRNFLLRNFDEEFLVKTITEKFNNNGKDINFIKKEEWDTLKKYFNSILEKDKKIKKSDEPKELDEILKKIGYKLVESKSYKDYCKYNKYFRKGEELCKFKDKNRIKKYRIFWLLKDGFENIKPKDKPNRHDEYSTSIMSFQVKPDGTEITQITSRYNHTVSNCDNLFNSNLENIHKGLTKAFNKAYGTKIPIIEPNLSYEFKDFVFREGKYIYYHTEVNGVKFGINTVISNSVIRYNPDNYYIWNNFIINTKTKKIEWDDKAMGYRDSFVDLFNNNVQKIIFVKSLEGVDDKDDDSVCYILKEYS